MTLIYDMYTAACHQLAALILNMSYPCMCTAACCKSEKEEMGEVKVDKKSTAILISNDVERPDIAELF